MRPVWPAASPTTPAYPRPSLTRALPSGASSSNSGSCSARYTSNTAAAPGADLSTLPPLPPPPALPFARRLQSPGPHAPLRLLMGAVVTLTAGRLGSLPPEWVAWLMRTQAALGAIPPAAWLAEAYDRLAAGVDELQPRQAAEAFLAVVWVAATLDHPAPHSASPAPHQPQPIQPPALASAPPPPPPPAELLMGLYRRLAAPPGEGPGAAAPLDPRVALACLEAAAAAEAHGTNAAEAATSPPASPTSLVSVTSRTAPATAGAGDIIGSGRVPAPGSDQQQTLAPRGCGLWSVAYGDGVPGMPRETVEALALAATGLARVASVQTVATMATSGPSPDNSTFAAAAPSPLRDGAGRGGTAAAAVEAVLPEGSAAAAAAAAARALVAAAHVRNCPGAAIVLALAGQVAQGCRSGAFSRSRGGEINGVSGAGSPWRGNGPANDSGAGSPAVLLDALAAACALRPAPLPSADAAALLAGLPDLLPAMDAVQVSYAVGTVSVLAAEAPGGTSEFIRGPAASALAERLSALTVAPPLAAALAALPPALRPLPAPLAAAAHEALGRCLAAASGDELTEVLRRLSDADALPPYGWQGALAVGAGRRLQDASAGSGAALVSSQELCNTLFVLAALNYRPGFSWTDVAAAKLQPRLLNLTPDQLTNALWALAKFGFRAEIGTPWSTYAVQALQLQLPSLAPHQLSYGLGSLQRIGCHINGAVLDDMLTSAADAVRQYPPGDLVLLLMTVARLRHVPSYNFTEAVTERLRPHVTAATLAAPPLPEQGTAGTTAEDSAAPVDPESGLGDAAAAGAVGGTTSPMATRGSQGRDRRAIPAVAGGAGGIAAAIQPDAEMVPLTCQELASVGYALAKLHSRPEADWMAAYMDACQANMGGFSPDLLASLLWAVGELGQAPSRAWMAAFLDAARPQLGDFAPQDLVSVLSSLAAMRQPPPAEWLGEALTVLGARVGGLDGAGVAALLKALVDLDARVSNPEWYNALCDQVSGFLPLLSPQALVDLVSSLGVLGHAPRKEWLTRCCTAAARVHAQAPASSQRPSLGLGGGLGQAGDSDGAARLSPGPQPGSRAGSSGSGGGGLSARQLDALVCGLAQLGAKPPQALLQAFFATTAPSLQYMEPKRVAAIASALAGAQVAPEPGWLDALAGAVRNGVMSYSLVQLDALTRALAVFQDLVPEHGGTRDLLAFLREFCLYG